jgi:hypothetical protein
MSDMSNHTFEAVSAVLDVLSAIIGWPMSIIIVIRIVRSNYLVIVFSYLVIFVGF